MSGVEFVTGGLILCQSDALARRVIYCLKGAGIETHIFANIRTSLRFSRYVKKYTMVDFPDNAAASADLTNLKALINTCVAIHSIDCVMASDIDSQVLLHELTPHVIGAACFPTSSNEVLHLLHDKWQFHQLLKAHAADNIVAGQAGRLWSRHSPGADNKSYLRSLKAGTPPIN